MNEFGVEKFKQMISKGDPQDIMILEPGTKESFKISLQIRDFLINEGYRVIFPCPDHLKCPMDESSGLTDWCHFKFFTSFEPSPASPKTSF